MWAYSTRVYYTDVCLVAGWSLSLLYSLYVAVVRTQLCMLYIDYSYYLSVCHWVNLQWCYGRSQFNNTALQPRLYSMFRLHTPFVLGFTCYCASQSHEKHRRLLRGNSQPVHFYIAVNVNVSIGYQMWAYSPNPPSTLEMRKNTMLWATVRNCQYSTPDPYDGFRWVSDSLSLAMATENTWQHVIFVYVAY